MPAESTKIKFSERREGFNSRLVHAGLLGCHVAHPRIATCWTGSHESLHWHLYELVLVDNLVLVYNLVLKDDAIKGHLDDSIHNLVIRHRNLLGHNLLHLDKGVDIQVLTVWPMGEGSRIVR